eukprot:Amastigsp_a2111_31.p5 type:complete len:105 gc:universal Amastigsp_a2111_31:645-331(-)
MNGAIPMASVKKTQRHERCACFVINPAPRNPHAAPTGIAAKKMASQIVRCLGGAMSSTMVGEMPQKLASPTPISERATRSCAYEWENPENRAAPVQPARPIERR